MIYGSFYSACYGREFEFEKNKNQYDVDSDGEFSDDDSHVSGIEETSKGLFSCRTARRRIIVCVNRFKANVTTMTIRKDFFLFKILFYRNCDENT